MSILGSANCSKQRNGRFVAACGGYWDARPVKQETLAARLEALATLLAISDESRHEVELYRGFLNVDIDCTTPNISGASCFLG